VDPHFLLFYTTKMSYNYATLPKAKAKAADGFSEECFFGGPSKPGALQSLLAQAIDRVPAGGEILWSTYYLANIALMEQLRLAALRGVKLMVALEARPRNPAVNAEAFKRLGALSGLSLVPVRSRIFSHLHEKLYYFSHPQPFFLVGSYNPSMDASLDADAVMDIGDQDHGHNMLVRVTNPQAVERVRQHLQAYKGEAMPVPANLPDELSVTFLPEDGSAPHLHWLARDWQTIHIAMSHLRDGTVVNLLARQARKGCKVHIISHHSHRRFPARHQEALRSAGVEVLRYCHPHHFPMHSKYTLLDNGTERISLYGSLNFTKTSRWLNREVLVRTHATRTHDDLLANWKDIREEIKRGYC
jgi:phosphatidylserine/phosphatidylglycerophosphate/cardiolipin synthase-like enzyme